MEDPVGSIIVGVGPTNYANHRQVLTVSSSNSVEDTKPTNGEGNYARANALGARVAIGSIASVELITAANKVEVWLGYEVIEKCEVEVTGHREHVSHADLY